jgi:hypothetical protein
MDLREMLDAVLAYETNHATRLAKSAAVVSEALRREGLEATVGNRDPRAGGVRDQ